MIRALACLYLLWCASTFAAAATDFIDCSETCEGGDVNYELTASVRTMRMMNYTYRGRTYSKPGSDSFMGPTMHVKPGQSLWIKLINELESDLGPHEPNAEDYWRMLIKPGEKIKYDFYRPSVSNSSLMMVDYPNIPKAFDHTNLHLHGLDVEVHMFDPVGTHDPDAPHIKIGPGQCYCYKFKVPDHHPPGMYWYHPHLHGSTAVQMWSGMLGVLYIDGPLDEELASYGVTRQEEFVSWDPAFRRVDEPTHDIEVDEFLMGQTTLSKIHPFLVNGKTNPTFEVSVGQVLWLRTLCGVVENEHTFIIYPEGKEKESWDDHAVPFWLIGEDGVTFSKPVQKTILVFAGGQRHEVLLQFDEPGTYVISQQGIQGMQFFGMYGHPHDQILATIKVAESDNPEKVMPKIPISEMRFTPGYPEEENIQLEDIAATESIVFSMGANRDQAPFPQYYVNGKAFSGNRLDFFAKPGEAREYILINANHNVHPFHIHVNRFQIKEMGSELSTEEYPVLEALLDYDPYAWRDIVVVPPNGRARIWVQYKNYTGKTVFHCHFLAHEDTGMMSTLFIGEPQERFLKKFWRERSQLVVGVGLGLLVGVGILYAIAKKEASQGYDAVNLNELKSKAID